MIIILSLSGLEKTRQTVMNSFSLFVFLCLSLLSYTTAVGNTTSTESTERKFYKHLHGYQPTEDFMYMGCFSKKNLNWIAKNTNYELTFMLDPHIINELSSICKGYFDQFDSYYGHYGVNVVALQHQMLLCINIPPDQDVRFLRVPESQCSIRTPSASGGTVSTGGINAIALYCLTPGNCHQNYLIEDGSNYHINVNGSSQYVPDTDTLPVQSVKTSYSHPSATLNYTTRYYDWNKDYLEIFLCAQEYRTPKQEPSALLSFWNAYVPHAYQKPYLCVEYCNDQYNYMTESREGHIPKYAVLSRSNKTFFGFCHCTDTLNGFYAMTIKTCPICYNATNCTSHYFTTHDVYCNDRNDVKSCKTEEPKAFISCKESAKCYAKDPYGSEWSACSGVTEQRPCPNPPSKNGTAFWVCQSNAQFRGAQPDYDNCTSDQLYNIENISRRTIFGSTSMKAKRVFAALKDLVIPAGPQPIGRSTTNYFAHEISEINNIVNKQVDEGLSSMIATPKEREDIVTDAVKVTANLIAVKDPWNQLNSGKRSQTATDCISSVEKNLFAFAEINNMAGASRAASVKPLDLFPIDKDPDGFRVTLGYVKDTKEYIKFPSDAETSFITVPKNSRFPEQEFHYVGIQMKSMYMEPLISPASNSPGKNRIERNSKVFNGNVISLTFSNASMGKLASRNGVEIKISHNLPAVGSTRKEFRRKLHPGEQRKAVLGETVCAYWDTKLLLWSSDGCKKITSRSNSQETVCECDHLTAFAILTDMHGYIGKDKGLEILTMILCSLSIFCLIATIVILTKMKVLHGERSTITKHLCVNLILGNLLLLLLVDRNYFFLSDISCTLVGIMTHYVFLSAFGWMALQGLYLHRMVFKIFDTGKSYMLVYTIGAYSYPLFPIALTAGIGYGVKDHPYGGEMFCWLNGDYIWAFLGPVAIILIGNLIVMVRTLQTVHNFKTPDLRTKSAQIRANRKWVKGCLALSVLLGLTWITGFFTLLDTPTFFFMSYVFTVLNASQGIFILIFFCLLHEKVQPLILKKLDLRKSSFTKTSDATDSRSSYISKQTSSTRVPDTRSQENETSFYTETGEANYDRATESVLFSNESNVHKYCSSDNEDDKLIEMGLQEIPSPPTTLLNSRRE